MKTNDNFNYTHITYSNKKIIILITQLAQMIILIER